MQGLHITSFEIMHSSFIRCDNCERFCFSYSLGVFNTHTFGYCVIIIFGQEGHTIPPLPPPPLPGRVQRFPYAHV